MWNETLLPRNIKWRCCKTTESDSWKGIGKITQYIGCEYHILDGILRHVLDCYFSKTATPKRAELNVHRQIIRKLQRTAKWTQDWCRCERKPRLEKQFKVLVWTLQGISNIAQSSELSRSLIGEENYLHSRMDNETQELF